MYSDTLHSTAYLCVYRLRGEKIWNLEPEWRKALPGKVFTGSNTRNPIGNPAIEWATKA
jgi:hypothetical protein